MKWPDAFDPPVASPSGQQPPYAPPPVSPSTAPSQRPTGAVTGPLDAHSTRFLLVTFAIIFLMAVTGVILNAVFDQDDRIFEEAIRIVGIGGPATAVGNNAAEAISRWRTGQQR